MEKVRYFNTCGKKTLISYLFLVYKNSLSYNQNIIKIISFVRFFCFSAHFPCLWICRAVSLRTITHFSENIGCSTNLQEFLCSPVKIEIMYAHMNVLRNKSNPIYFDTHLQWERWTINLVWWNLRRTLRMRGFTKA